MFSWRRERSKNVSWISWNYEFYCACLRTNCRM